MLCFQSLPHSYLVTSCIEEDCAPKVATVNRNVDSDTNDYKMSPKSRDSNDDLIQSHTEVMWTIIRFDPRVPRPSSHRNWSLNQTGTPEHSRWAATWNAVVARDNASKGALWRVAILSQTSSSAKTTCFACEISSVAIPAMTYENFASPNLIPPRRSSTGLSMGFLSPKKTFLKPVPEADWLTPISSGRLPPDLSSGSPPTHSTLDPFSAIGQTEKTKVWSQDKEKILLGPFEYMFQHPGKDIRTLLIKAFNEWLRVPEESLAIITKVVGMLHTASLLWVAGAQYRRHELFAQTD